MISLTTYIIESSNEKFKFCNRHPIIVLVLPFQAFSQSEDTVQRSLKDQFQDMLESSESYTDYKVISKVKLNEYSTAVQDTISKSRNQIASLNAEVKELKPRCHS
jgi:hypothetical protein